MSINNKNTYISTYDYGFLYGFSIFETFVVSKNGDVFLLEKHIERMINSARFFGISNKMTKAQLLNKVVTYINDNVLSDVILRMTMSAGNNKENLFSSIAFSYRQNVYTQDKISKGFKVSISEVRKSESSIVLRHKTSNYLENYILMNKAVFEGFDDVVFMNTSSEVTETTRSNIFFVRDSVLYTPHKNCGLLPGVIRQWVIEEAYRQNIKCIEGYYNISDLISADEVFITNSAMGIMHVKSIDGKDINNGALGTITEKIADFLRKNQ